jgi:hypothetical protein
LDSLVLASKEVKRSRRKTQKRKKKKKKERIQLTGFYARMLFNKVKCKVKNC